MSERAAPRREPKQSRSRDTVEVVLDAAERILRNEGPQALTTKHVAAVAGVGVGTLYQYFPSKDAIVAAF